jgi:peptidyl-tRNA hydrolase
LPFTQGNEKPVKREGTLDPTQTRQWKWGSVFRMLSANLSSQSVRGSFAKVCCRVDSAEELMEIYNKAVDAGLEVHLITDSGKTEFHGQPTRTCLAIGPADAEKIDPITGELELL